jgi:hypothetical protein
MIKKFNIFKDKIFESLPRQSTVDQLKRIRAEIMGDQEVKIGPETIKMHSDVGDRVIDDLKKHQQNNLFWWDNPVDRYICSYEDFVKKDARKSLGYTKDNDKSPKPTDISENFIPPTSLPNNHTNTPTGELRYKPGDIVYVFQYHQRPATEKAWKKYLSVDEKYIVGKGESTQKWCKVEIIKPISDENGWERYKVKQIDGYRQEKEFIAFQNQMSKYNDRPIALGYFNPDENR